MGFAVVVVAGEEGIGSVAELGEGWVVVEEEGKILLEVVCLVVEEEGNNCG